MTYLLLVLAVAALAHFVYESILAPSLRLKLRFKLFALQDQLRILKICNDAELDDKHYRYLEKSPHSLIRMLHRIDLATLASSELAYQRDPKFRERVTERSRILDDCAVDQAKQIRAESLRIATKALVVNSGAAFVLFFPITLLMFLRPKTPASVIRASVDRFLCFVAKPAAQSPCRRARLCTPAAARGDRRPARRPT